MKREIFRVSIKYVRKANQWCKTTLSYNDKGELKQDQEWFSTEKEARGI